MLLSQHLSVCSAVISLVALRVLLLSQYQAFCFVSLVAKPGLVLWLWWHQSFCCVILVVGVVSVLFFFVFFMPVHSKVILDSLVTLPVFLMSQNQSCSVGLVAEPESVLLLYQHQSHYYVGIICVVTRMIWVCM